MCHPPSSPDPPPPLSLSRGSRHKSVTRCWGTFLKSVSRTGLFSLDHHWREGKDTGPVWEPPALPKLDSHCTRSSVPCGPRAVETDSQVYHWVYGCKRTGTTSWDNNKKRPRLYVSSRWRCTRRLSFAATTSDWLVSPGSLRGGRRDLPKCLALCSRKLASEDGGDPHSVCYFLSSVQRSESEFSVLGPAFREWIFCSRSSVQRVNFLFSVQRSESEFSLLGPAFREWIFSSRSSVQRVNFLSSVQCSELIFSPRSSVHREWIFSPRSSVQRVNTWKWY